MPEPAPLILPTSDTPVAAAAVMYCEAGFAVVPLYGINADGSCTCGMPECEPRSAGKHPIGKAWQRHVTADPDEARERFRAHRGNIGLLMGPRLVTIDIDGPEGFASLPELGELPETLTARTGSGGEHRIYSLAPYQDAGEITNRAVAHKIDVKTRSGQIVVAPSRHRSGAQYTWTVVQPPVVLPAHVYEHIRKPRVIPITDRLPARRGSDLAARARAYVAAIPPAISGSGGHAQTFAAARALVGWTRKGLSEADALGLLREYNARCEPPWTERELDHKWADAQRATDIPEIEDRPAPERAPAATSAPAPSPAATSWRERLIFDRSKTGEPKLAKHPENAIVIVRYHPAWEGRIRLDTHSSTVTVTDAPWHDSDAPAGQLGTRPWTDADTIRLSAWIKREEHTDLSPEACDRAVLVAAEANTYHPVRDWLGTLEWDGVLRLHAMGERYFGAAPAPHYEPFRWWMIAAVARTFEPGCKVDNVLILEGAQGLRKSSALAALASPQWFSDTPLDLQSKDAIVALQGKLIVELAELETLRRADAARAKAFFSSRVDDYRPPYGKRNIKAPRQCVFAGTVNHASYLQDSTGNRRYWPVACTSVDLEALRRDRAQLWAEAVAAYRAGDHWWPEGPEAHAACEAAQAPRAEGDAWEALIAAWLSRHAGHTPSVGELLDEVLGIPKDRWTRSDQMRVANIMQALGWSRKQVRSGTNREWRYTPTVTGKAQ